MVLLKKPKKIKLSTAKKRAWKAFSLYVRYKDVDCNGLVECYTCGKKFDPKKMTAGHAIGGRTNALLFCEDLVRPQCVACNIYSHGKYYVFQPKIMEEVGSKKFASLVARIRRRVKYTTEDYLAIEKRYTQLFGKLKKNK